MKKNYKLIINILIIILLLFSTTSFAEESTNTTDTNENEDMNLNLYSESCILIEHSTGRTAYEKNSDKQMYPASITKILTAILTVENCNLNDTVTITNEMISKVPAGYTTAYLTAGEKVTVEQLLNVLLIPSANDAGFALAIHISGSVEKFADLMNAKAEEIGCTNSHFTNPSGIHDEEHYSTAKDMALITLYATNYPQITDIGCKTSYTLHPSNSNSRTFYTTNTLIKPESNSYYEYATGLKTGFTEPAGSCIIATAKKDDMEFLAVILNAPEPKNNVVYRDEDCKTLFEYGFANYEDIVKVEEPANQQIIAQNDEQITGYLKNSPIKGITLSIILKIGLSLLGIYILLVIIKSRSKKSIKN